MQNNPIGTGLGPVLGGVSVPARHVQVDPALVSLGLKRASISAVITRADGTVEDLGEIAATEFQEAGR